MRSEDRPERIGVGLVGVSPPDSWAVLAHLPALAAREDRFHVTGIANSSEASARAAAADCGNLPAYASVDALCADPAVDVVAVCVRADRHAAIVETAIAAGKHVYCEWPLGANLAETNRLAELARASGRRHVCGSQAGAHPVIRQAAALLREGRIGRPLHASLVADAGSWGAAMPERYAYSLDAASGASVLTVPFAHTLVGLEVLFGRVASVCADVGTRRATSLILETGEHRPLANLDFATVALRFADGLPLSAHYRGGFNKGRGFDLRLIGEDGEMRITGDPFGAIEMIDLELQVAVGAEPLAPVAIDAEFRPAEPLGIIPDNVGAVWDWFHADLVQGTGKAPDFAAALRIHSVLDAIERSSAEGRRIACPA